MPLLDFPTDMYELHPGEKPLYGDFPDLKRCVRWFKSLITESEWKDRREEVAKRFYQSLVGEFQDPKGVGRFFDNKDKFSWYLFLGEAFTDHPWNYEVVFGCRVIPVLAAIGRNLDLLLTIGDFETKARGLFSSDKSQPNGTLFEFLVAAAYARAGGQVAFHATRPGIEKTFDLDVNLNGKSWAIECKRLEAGEYVEQERQRMRELWVPSSMLIAKSGRSAILNCDFYAELSDVPLDYFHNKSKTFVETRRASFLGVTNIQRV